MTQLSEEVSSSLEISKELDPLIPSKRQPTKKDFAEACLVGGLRGLMRLPIEHPFDRVKTLCQARPGEKKIMNICSWIYREQGPKGFYAGWIPNGIRMTIKELYRWPLMLAIPPFVSKSLPVNARTKDRSTEKLIAGFTVATVESFILCPIERIKVLLMTRSKEEPVKWTDKQVLRTLTTGWSIMYMRQMIAWTSFLYADAKVKGYIKSYTEKDTLTAPELILTASTVGVINTLATMPFDSVKTNIQSVKYLDGQKVPLRQVVAQIYNDYGWRGFYRGTRVRLLQFICNALFSVSLLEYMEQRWKHFYH